MSEPAHFDLAAIGAALDRGAATAFEEALRNAETPAERRVVELGQRFWPMQRLLYLSMLGAENDGYSRAEVGAGTGCVLGSIVASFLKSASVEACENLEARLSSTIEKHMGGSGHGIFVAPTLGGHA